MSVLSRRAAVLVFLAFAFGYFLSALIRVITATLSPTLTQEFALSAGDLGLLAGGYFLGFASTQLPLGRWLDRYGPKRVILSFMGVAVAGCLAFSLASNFTSLLLARILCGVGLSACLMAPLTGYRRWFSAVNQLRANSWMLMSASSGMVAATLPVQWLMPLLGWRALFWGLALLVLLAMGWLAWQVPAWQTQARPSGNAHTGYAEVWRHAYFRKMAPLGFFSYGGLMAIQTLWAVPWMTRVADYTAPQASQALFWINIMMLLSFWTWGMVNPWLARQGFHADRLIAAGMPISFIMLSIIILGAQSLAGASGLLWGLFCMSCTFVVLAQPAVGMAFPAELAGRALSAYNLVIFSGVFAMQWGIGLLIDGLRLLGWTQVQAFQGAMTVFLGLSMGAYAYFLTAKKS